MVSHDITWPLHEGTLVYPGDPTFAKTLVATVGREGYAMSSVCLGAHTGTHVDAPAHFFEGGMTIDQVHIDVLVGPSRVVDARSAGQRIDERFLSHVDLEGVERLLLRTVNEALGRQRFVEDYAVLTPGAARYLREIPALRLVGVDYLSIEGASDPAFPVHHALLREPDPIIIVESLDLRGVRPGDFELVVMPLKVVGGEASPARAVLLHNDQAAFESV